MTFRMFGAAALLVLSVSFAAAQTAETDATGSPEAPAGQSGDVGLPTEGMPSNPDGTVPEGEPADTDGAAVAPGSDDGSAAEPALSEPTTGSEDASTTEPDDAVLAPDAAGEAMSIEEPSDPGVEPLRESTLITDFATPHGIQSDGAYRYSYPLALPSFRGLEPKLSLDYTSLGWTARDVDNFLGSGWRLGGLSKIERRTATGGPAPHDELRGALFLDAMQLLSCADDEATNRWTPEPYSGDKPLADHQTTASSASCRSGGNFTTERETYLRITFVGRPGSIGSKIHVWRPDGTRWTYETLGAIVGVELEDAPLESSSGYDAWVERRNIYALNTWLLTEIRRTASDRLDSTVTIDYEVSGYAYVPKSIQLGNDAEGYKVWFNYDTFPFEEPVSKFATGESYWDTDADNAQGEPRVRTYPEGKQLRRLKSVVLRQGGVIRAWRVNQFHTTEGTDSHVLSSIRAFGSDAVITNGEVTGGSGLPPTRFTYDIGRDFSNDQERAGQGLLLERIETSEGGVRNVAYMKSDDSDVASGGRNPVRYLVREIEDLSGREKGAAPVGRIVTYRYDGDGMNALANTSRGFEKVYAYLPQLEGEASAPVIVSRYANALDGGSWLLQKEYRVGNEVLERVVYEYDTRQGRPYRNQLREIRHISREGTGTGATETIRKRTFRQTAYGQIDRVQNWGYIDDDGSSLVPGERLTTFYGFAPKTNAETYIVDRIGTYQQAAGLVDEPESVQPNAFLLRRNMYYDSKSTPGELGTAGLLTQARTLNADGNTVTVDHVYDDRGNRVRTTGPRSGQTSTASYGGPSALFRLSATNALGHTVTTTWDYGCQLPLRTTDANGLVTKVTYDAHCREATRELPTGHVTTTRYRNLGDPLAQHVEVSAPSASDHDNRKETWARTYFDGAGRTWKTLRSSTSSDPAFGIVTQTGYDARGNTVWATRPRGADSTESANYGDLAIASRFPADDVITRMTYDDRNRLVRTDMPNGGRTTLTYDHQMLGGIRHRRTVSKSAECYQSGTQGQAPCQETHVLIGGRGWTVQQIAIDPTSEAQGTNATAHVTAYGYDALGRVTRIDDPRGATFRYSYDQAGNRIETNDPDLGVWTMSYDVAGNLTSQIDAKGQETRWTYDALDRAVRKRVLDRDGVTVADYAYSYDQVRTGYHNVGQLTEASIAGLHTVTYNYDDLGNLARERHSIDPGTAAERTYAFETTYYANGAVRAVRLPSSSAGGANATTHYGPYKYDAAGRPVGFDTYIASITYDRRDNPTAIAYGNGVTDSRTYDTTMGWLEETSVPGVTTTRLTRARSGRILS